MLATEYGVQQAKNLGSEHSKAPTGLLIPGILIPARGAGALVPVISQLSRLQKLTNYSNTKTWHLNQLRPQLLYRVVEAWGAPAWV